MKKILIISNEETPQKSGYIPNPERYGLPIGIDNIGNLIGAIKLAGDYEITVLHHSQINQVQNIHPDCAVLSGRFSEKALPYEEMLREYEDVLNWIRVTNIPILGICMGLQLICAAFGVGTKQLHEKSGEYGFTKIALNSNHCLLKNLPLYIDCMELHRCGVEKLPENFELLASSDICPIQMVMHSSRPIVGTQFHPELYAAEHDDGRLILTQILSMLTR